MKKLLAFSTLFMICAYAGHTQSMDKNINGNTANFYDVQKSLNDHYKDVPLDWLPDDDWKKFKRWESYVEPRVFPSGQAFDPAATYKALQEQNSKSNKTTTYTGNWSYLGPGNYSGRVNCVAVDPNDSNAIWLGGPDAGIWRSSNGGASWTDLTNNMPALSVSDFAINPKNSNTVYVATGDKYASFTFGFYCNYSMGVIKSTNGGASWNPTGLSYNVSQFKVLNRIIINPQQTDTLLVASAEGIWRTSDGGTTWQKKKSGNVWDVEFHPTNPNIAYAVTDSIFRTTDGGITWSWVNGSPIFTSTASVSYRRVSIAVSPAVPNNVYILSSDMNKQGKMYKSTDAGLTFNTMNAPNTTSMFGWYGSPLEVSPVNPNRIVVGGYSWWQTLDGGTTWSGAGAGYTDVHTAAFLPQGSSWLAGDDGGVFKKSGNSFIPLYNGLQLTQFYRLGGAATNQNIIFCGQQDGSILKYNGGLNTWNRYHINDGTECAVDYTNSNTVYMSYQYGGYSKSLNGGVTYTAIPTGSGSWTAPFVIHPSNPQILFYAGNTVRKSTDGGQTFNDISTSGPSIYALAVSKSNPNYIYYATYGTIYRTINGGTNWSNITGTLPTSYISYIAISGSNPDVVWVTYGSYLSGQKVYMTINGGVTWTNVSGIIPNVPVNCVEYDNNSANDAVYVGTDIGVYYSGNTTGGWIYFNSGLPAVSVNELEIHYGSGKIRAATFGRGLWESMTTLATSVPQVIKTKSTISVYPNPGNGEFNIDINTDTQTDVLVSVYDLSGVCVGNWKENAVFSKKILILVNRLPVYILLK